MRSWCFRLLVLAAVAAMLFSVTACDRISKMLGREVPDIEVKGIGIGETTSTPDEPFGSPEGTAAPDEEGQTDGSSGGVTADKQPAPFRILTQARNNPVRKLLLDVVRNDPQMGSERGTRFVVRWLAVQSPWAMFQGETEGKLTPVEALLERIGSEWVVVDLEKTNGRKITASRYPKVPRRVFGPASFSLAPRTNPADELQILTNARGNPTRGAILDALRGRFTPDTVFVVRWLRVKRGWAYFMGDARTPSGELPLDAILKHRSWGWEVLEVQGEGDFPESIPDMYAGDAPSSIFP